MSYRKLLLVALALCVAVGTAEAKKKKQKFTVAWSIYVGWMPWDYADSSGILKKWADKYDIEIDLRRMDYIASIEAFVAEQVDACTMTNMEMLDMPSASGIDSTAIIIGDYSNGNDALLVRDGLDFAGLKGKEVSLVELSVSHYLLARCLEQNNMKESDVTIVNTSDSDIAPAFLANDDQKAVVTWNPMVIQLDSARGVESICSSADIPGEIVDMMVVRSKVLDESPALAKALTGAWYEVMAVMSKRGGSAKKAMQQMGKAAGSTLAEFQQQLKTTAMFWNPKSGVSYAEGDDIKEKMNFVRQFCFSHGLLGESAKSVDEVGIQYPDGTVQGDKKSISMRFDTKYMRMAEAGDL